MYPPPPPLSPKRKNYGLRVLAVSAVGLVLGFGLCTAAVMSGGGKYGDLLGQASATVYGLSAVGLLVGIVWAIVTAVGNSRPR